MKKIIFNLFCVVFLVTLSLPLMARGKKEQPPQPQAAENTGTDAVQPADTQTQNQNSDPAAEQKTSDAQTPVYNETQKKMSSLGFQIPKGDFDAPPFSAEFLDGTKGAISDYKGKIVFLNFWATWCPPCKKEMPSIENLYAKLSGEPFQILAVNVNEPKENVEKFLKENKYTFPIMTDPNGQVSSMYAVEGIPTTWLIDQKGKVLGRLVGSIEWDSPEIIGLFHYLISQEQAE